MSLIDKTVKSSDKKIIYLSIDHLKSGKYQLNILLDNKVIKTISIKK